MQMGVLRRGGMLALVAVMGLTAVLGGCSADKKRADMATQEAAELREKNAQLEQALRDKDAAVAMDTSRNTGGADEIPGTVPQTKRAPRQSANADAPMIHRDEKGRLGAEIA